MLVGDYIHFRYTNYRLHGLEKTGGEEPNPLQIFSDQRTAIMNNSIISQNQKRKESIKSSLEQQLNFFFNPTDGTLIELGYSTNEIAAITSEISSLCQNAIDQAVKNVTINWDNLSAKNIENISIKDNGVYEELSKVRKTRLGNSGGKEKQASTKEAIARRIKALVQLREQLNNELIDGSVDQEFIDKLNTFESKYKEIINPLMQEVNQQNKKKQTKFLISDRGFIDELQQLIDDTKQVTAAQVNGIIAEYVPVITQAVMGNFTQSKVEDVLKKLTFSRSTTIDLTSNRVTANQRSHKEVVSTFVRSKVGRSQANMSKEAEFNNAKVKIGSTYDKVDVQLEISDNELINASVKNISAGAKNVTILSGRSSLQFLQHYPEFANHYLNITAQHCNRKKSNGENVYDVDPPANHLQAAHDMMRLTIALHALIGQTYGKKSGNTSFGITDAAEIMVVNERSKNGKGHFKVIFMSDILDKINKDIDLVSIQNFNELYRWPNEWVDNEAGTFSFKTAYARIYNMLGNLHAQQLKVTIKKSALS